MYFSLMPLKTLYFDKYVNKLYLLSIGVTPQYTHCEAINTKCSM